MIKNNQEKKTSDVRRQNIHFRHAKVRQHATSGSETSVEGAIVAGNVIVVGPVVVVVNDDIVVGAVVAVDDDDIVVGAVVVAADRVDQ